MQRMQPSTLLQPSLRPRNPHLTKRTITKHQLSPNPTRSFTLSSSLRANKPSKSPKPPRPTPAKLPYSPSAGRRRPPSQTGPTPDLVNKFRWPALMGAAVLGMAAAVYALPFAASLYKDFTSTSTDKDKTPVNSPACCSGCLIPTGRPAGLDASRAPNATPRERREAAEEFDRGVAFPEWVMGISGLRRTLGVEAQGDVLELAVGTGRNLGFYDWSVVVAGGGGEGKEKGEGAEEKLRSFTGVDISVDMVGVARDRLRDAVPGLANVMRRRRAEPLPESGLAVEVLDGRARLFVGDAEKDLPAPPSGEGKYDTVIQTFGLCSVAEPGKLLASAASAVKPDTGRIILMEHGRGWWELFNTWVIDRKAEDHFERFGCWWNRDIEALVREGEKTVPGLEVVALKRPLLLQFGTVLLIELRVNSKKMAMANEKSKTEDGKTETKAKQAPEENAKHSWW